MRGGQWQVFYLLQDLTRRGVECRLLAPSQSPLFEKAQTAGLDVQALSVFDVAIQARKADLIHAHDARAHTLGLLSRAPLVVSRRVAFPIQRTLLSRYKYRRPTLFLAVSQYVRVVLFEAGVPGEKICVVHDGVRLPEPTAPEDRPRVVAIDSGDPGKGKLIVEEAARLAKIPIQFSQDLQADLPGAALFVYITNLEGFGSAALLAMAHGVPVLKRVQIENIKKTSFSSGEAVNLSSVYFGESRCDNLFQHAVPLLTPPFDSRLPKVLCFLVPRPSAKGRRLRSWVPRSRH